jgi:hypothetical protein
LDEGSGWGRDLAETDSAVGAGGGAGGVAGQDAGVGGAGGLAGGLDGAVDSAHSADVPLAADRAVDAAGGGGGLSGSDGGVDAPQSDVSVAKDSGADTVADSGGFASKDGPNGSLDSAAKDGGLGDVDRSDGSSEAGGPCCGCLCRDPSWSCSSDTCVDSTGHAVTLAAEAGFFELTGGNYVSEGLARVSPTHRIWYAFRPANVAPASKPLAVFFNGGPGSATSAYLFSFNTGPWTLDPAATGTAQIVANTNNWAQFANLLYIDAPGAGFSYPMSLDGGAQPSVGIDLDREAASVIRVVVRFLDRHIPLQSNPVILVGESYGGTRATLMMDRLLNYQLLATSGAAYQDAALYGDLLQHFGAVFPGQNAQKLSAQQIATQFGHQALIEPVVAGQYQWSLNQPDNSVCVVNYDIYQCDMSSGWTDQAALVASTNLTTLATLRQALGVDPTTIDWLHAAARTRAYGRSSGSVVNTPEMTAAFGVLGADDNYFLIRNFSAGSPYDATSRWWTDPAIGVSFLDDVIYVKTFITNARLDMDVWAPAIPAALGQYSSIVSSSVYDSAPRTGFVRLGWIDLTYLPAVISGPATREIRFPYYAAAGHTATIRAPGEILADVMQWYADLSASSVAPASQSLAPSDKLASTSSARATAPVNRLMTEQLPYMGP